LATSGCEAIVMNADETKCYGRRDVKIADCESGSKYSPDIYFTEVTEETYNCNPSLTSPPQFCRDGTKCSEIPGDECQFLDGIYKCACPTPAPAPQCSHSSGFNNHGENIPPGDNPVSGVWNWQGCNQECIDNFFCVGWTFLHGKCYIKSKVECMTPDDNAESGYCRPSEGPPQCSTPSPTPAPPQATTWTRYAKNCWPGHGADVVLLQGCAGGSGDNCYVSTSTVSQCRALCLATSGCEAIVMNADENTCYGRKDVVVADCPSGANWPDNYFTEVTLAPDGFSN
jgi:hypothetical protein